MNNLKISLFFVLSTVCIPDLSLGVELTFELPDSSVECFYEEIEKNTSATLEFQVVSGGHYDVDVYLTSPDKQIIYKQVKMQFDSHQFVAPISGTYAACFSNEFSTFTHKIVYMEFSVGPESKLLGSVEHATVMTQLETSVEEIYSALKKILDHQTHHRLREAQSRKRAEELNETVFLWSMFETIAVILVTVGQVIILRNFFTDRPASTPLYGKK